MAWTELTSLRTRRNRTYEEAGKRKLCCRMPALNYESVVDSGVHDADIDMTPVRVDVPAFDGWRITQNGWH